MSLLVKAERIGLMGKSFEFKECERFLKRVLKDKGMYSKGAVIAFLITGGIGFFAPPAQAIIYVETDLDSGATGASSYSNGNGNIHLPRNSVVFAPIRNGNVYGDLNRTAKNSVIIGAGSYAHGIVEGAREEKFTAVGNNAHVAGGQGTAIGSNTFAVKQATAVGNDVYAAGDSSIAIGNDDISTKYKDSLSRETLKGIFGNGESNNPAVAKLFREGKWYSSENDAKGPFKLTSWSDFNRSYLSDGTEMYSPTYAGGVGAIAIGSRSIAYKDGSTAIGTLSYAFGEGSTAMGLRAYTAENAKGAVAIGEQSRSFAPQSLAVGNRNESTDDGAMSYGYSAKAVGKGSLAFGYKTYANASIANNIAAADGHSATNPLRQAVRSKLGNYSEAQLAALETYQNKAREYYAKIDARASEAAIAAAKTAMDNAKADVDAITLTDVNAMALVDGGQVSHQGWNTVGNTIKSVVDAVEDKNATNKLTVEKLDGVYLTTKDEDGNTQTVQKSKKSGDNAIAIGYYASAKGTSAIAEGSGSVVDSLSGIGIGSLSYVSENSANSIAVGVGAQVRKENSIAIGTQSQVFGAGAIGMGPGSRVMGDNSVAMGYGTDIRSVSSIGLGVRAKVGYGSMNATGLGANVNIGTDAGNTVALGSSASIGDNSLNSMAVGYNANVANNTPNSIAFGTRARIAEGATSSLAVGDLAAVTKASSTALGRLATADFENSVALGYRSNTHYWGNPNTRESNFSSSASDSNKHGLSIAPYLPQGSTLGDKLKKLDSVTAGYVSVGGWDEKDANGRSTGRRGLRRIVNVAPGALDTDAVTVAQLRDWTDKSAHFLSIAGASNKSATDYPDINDPLGTKSNNAVVKIKSNFDNDTATGTNALALGVYAYANGQKSVAMGPNAYANVDHGVAIGDSAQAWSEGSNGNAGVAIGKEAKAYYWNALALGTNARVSGAHSLAFGPNARVGVVKTVDAATGNVTNKGTMVNDGIAIGRDTAIDGTGSIALGAASNVTTATNAVAIGTSAQVLAGKDADNKAVQATGAVALGSNASVTGSQYSVALGLNSSVVQDDTKEKTRAAFTNEEINDPGNGVVSVGNNTTVKRRIINVASGVNDNDAVTVKQLKAAAPKYYSVNTTEADNRTVNSVNDVKSNVNNDGATGAGAVAVGSYTRATGNYSSAIGRDVITSAQLSTGIGTNVTVSGDKSVGIGNNVEVSNHSAVAIGLEAKSDHARGIAVGYKVNVNESDTFAGGSEVNVTGYGSVGIGKKVETRANNAVGIGASTNALGSESIALGYAAYTGYTTTENIANPPAGGPTTRTVYNGATEGVAIGKEAVVESNYAIAIGGNAKVKRDGTKDAESSVAIGAGAKVTGAKYSVALGLNSEVNASDTATKTTAAFSGESNDDPSNGVVSVGKSGKYRRILNVAGGVNDNDAVNVKQLKQAAWGLKTQSGTAAATGVTPDANGKVTLKAGNNVTIDNANGVVTVNATGIQSVSSGNANALNVTTTNGAVTITPNLAGTITGTGNDANKLVTAGVVNTALNNIPVTSFKADAGGNNGTEGVFTPTSSNKQVNITGAGVNGTTRQTWTQGTARFDSDNIGTHVNSNGRILVGLKTKIAVNEVATYDYNTAGERQATQGPTLSFAGLDMKNKKITNVAGGEINATSTDAINGSQLHSKLAEKANVTDLANKLDTTAELHVKAGDYTVGNNGEVSLIQEDANGTQNNSKGFKIKNIATRGDITNINTTLGGKADKSYVDTQIGTVSNLGYKAVGETAKQVAVGTGLTFTPGTGTVGATGANAATTNAATPKTGIAISTAANGVVNIGLDAATRSAIDNAATKSYVDTKFGNAANKDLDNLNDAGKNEVRDLATSAVKVAAGKNVTVTDATTNHVTTYTVNAIDTKVIAGEGLEATGGDTVDAATNTRNYTVGLSADTQAKLAKVDNLANTVGTIGADGRDGKAGTGKDPKAADAAAGDKGLTGKDGLNGKDLTSKVNALRNGEAGTVVYTDENGNRLAKANDGNYYPATAVDKDGNVLNNTPAATTVQARLVNPDGTTTGGTTKLSNIADGEIAAGSTDAINGGQLHSKLAEKADKSDITTINNTLASKANASDLTTLAEKVLTFSGDTGTNATRKLGETLAVKGAANFTPAATATPGVNIQVASDPTNGLTVSLADTLTNMKGISGNGKDPLVIKNGDQSITITPTTAAETSPEGTVTKPAQVGKVDFGNSKVTSSATPTEANDLVNKGYLEKAIEDVNSVATGNAKLGYKANTETDIKKVAVGTGLHFKSGTGTIGATGADAATPKTGIAISTEENGVVNIGLDEATRKVLDNAAKLGDTAVDGRDGKPGTGDNAGMGKDGLTKADGLNGKDLTSKVNALRNGEAGTVVYTDENGKRVVKANDGKWYLADKVDATGNKLDGATEVTTPQARLVNPDGTTTGGTTKLSNIADGEIAAGSHDAVTGGQLFTKLAEKADKSVVDNLTTKVNTNTTDIAGLKTTVDKAITFKGDDNQGVERKLDTTLTVKGAANFDPTGTNPATAAGVNIRVEKDTTTNANGLVVKLADTLTGMKGISGNGTNDLVIKNGDTVVTVKPGANGAKGDVDFGGSKLTNIGTPGANTDVANKAYVDTQVGNAADKNLSNLNTAGEEKVKDLAAAAVKVAPGKNVTVTPETTNHVTTYTVNAIDTKVIAGEGLEATGGDTVDAATNTRNYTVGLSADTQAKLAKVDNLANTVGTIGADGRDGKAGTGKDPKAADAAAGDKGLTGKDGLNGKDLTSKVNALRNGEAGTVVYTDDKGNRLVKANDGNYYPATAVDKDGNVLNNTPAATTVQARLVNPDGTTTGGTTKLSNIADGEIAAGSTDAINGGQLHSKLAEKADKADITTINNTLAGKVDKSSELHVKADTYAVGEDGVVTVKQEDGTGAEATGKEFKISGLATKTDITTINTALGQKANASDLTTLAEKPLTFSGDTGTDATRKLGTTLAVKGAANFTPAATATAGVNIQVASDPTNGLTVSLADTLTNMKGISGNGKDPLVIKNGDQSITITPTTAAETSPEGTVTKPAQVGKVDFGNSKVTSSATPTEANDLVNKGYLEKAIEDVNSVATGNAKLGYKANAETDIKKVAVGTGLHFKSGTGTIGATGADATTTNAATTKTGIAISTEENGVVNIGLDEATRKVLDNAAKLGDTAVDGRDGKPGTGDNAGMGKDGLTKADGLNGKDLTSKVNALRNGEAGTVVYTDENGKRVVKANDGKWYLADKVDATGNKLDGATEVATPQARLVNTDGTTTGGMTVFNNVASAIPAAATDGSKPTFLDNLNTAAGDAKTKNAAVNVSDLNSTATEIIAKGLTFQGNDGNDIKKQLGETLHIIGEGTVPATTTTAANNIRTKKTNDGKLEIGLAKDLVGITSVTNATTTDGVGTKVEFGNDGVTIKNTQAVPTDAAPDTKPVVTTVTIGKDGINAGDKVISNVAAPTADKDAANKAYVDTQVGNAANKDLSNLNDTGKNEVRDLAAGAVKVAPGKNVTVTDATTNHVTTYTVNAIDTKVIAGEGLEATGGDTVDAATNTRNYTVGLSADTQAKLAKVDNLANTVGTIGADGRDGKAGTGKDPKAADAAAGDKGLTGQDGLNGKDLTSKVNALRNGEAGTVVYTDENGNRLVKANDGNYYPATAVDKDGNVLNNAQPATTVQARLVNPDGSATTAEGAAGTKLSNIANGTIADKSKDAVNGGQLHTAKQELATALGGNATVTNGVLTGPTYEITKDDGTNGKDSVNNVGAAIDKLDTRINTVKGLAAQPLTFTGDDAQDVTRALGTTLTVKGAANFDPTGTNPATAAGVNIRVEKDPTTDANGLVVKLADTLTNMKGISGNGKDPLVIKNGDQSITITPTLKAETDPESGNVTKPAQTGKIDFGGSKLTHIAKPEENADVVNKKYVDDAIKNVNNTVAGNATLRYSGDTTTGDVEDGNLKLALATDSLKVEGTEDQIVTTATAGKIKLSLSEKVTERIHRIGEIAGDGRDGKPGNTDPTAIGKDGLTKADGLNGKDLTTKINALRNGEAGTVVYTDAEGKRVVKAKDGNFYKADEVKPDGTVKTAAENGGKEPEAVTAPQARLVNTDGTTTGGTTVFNNVASPIANTVLKDDQNQPIANASFLDRLKKTAADAQLQNAAVNVSDLNKTATEIIAKGLTFQGNDAQDIKKQLGETLHIIGEGTVPATTTTAANNIRTKKTNDNKLEIGLAKDLVGITSVTNATTTDGVGTKVEFGNDGVTIKNTQAVPTDAAPDTKPVVTTVTIGKDGINAGDKVISNVAAPTADKDAANKAYVDTQVGNAANKNLDNLNEAGINKVKDLAAAAVKVAAGKNTKVTADDSTPNTTTYVVDANDTVVTSTDTALSVTGGEVAGDNVRTYKLALSKATKDTLAKVDTLANTVGTIGADGRDGKAGTGKDPKATDAVAGDKGLTGKDGLNGKDLTSKVNALRNGEAGTVVYTDDKGNRVVKANDGNYYKADDVKADGTVKTADENGGKAPEVVTAPQARLVNPDGSTTTADTATGTKLSNIANGTIADKSKDAVNGGQLHTAKQEMANALGGNAGVDANGALTQPTYSITKDDATGGADTVNNVGAAVSKLDTRINTVKGLAKQPLTFTGDDGQNVERALGTTLTVKGAKNFTPSATTPKAIEAGVNIRVEKDTTTNANGLVVKLADTLTDMKGISGNGTDNLVIKNGINTITVTPSKAEVKDDQGTVTTPADPGKVNFGDATVTVKNLDAPITYRANSVTDDKAKTVSLKKGLDFAAGDGTTATAEAAKTGLHIETGDDGKVIIGLSNDAKTKLDKVNDIATAVGTNGVDGRDGKPGTGDNAGIGKDGLTGADGLNGKDLTSKVNALRNGEAGSVVYTDAEGNRVVKAADGKWYPANKVNADGTKATDAAEVKTPQARLVNPDGSTTIEAGKTGTVFNNVASAIPAAAADGAKPTFLDNLNTAAGDAKTKNAAVNVSDLNSTATEIIAKGLTFQGNDQQGIKKQLGETLDIVGEGTLATGATTAANNIRTKKNNDGKLEIGLAKDLVGITSVTNASTTDGAGTKLALDGNNLTITNTQAVPENAPVGTAPTVTTVTIGKDGINAGSKVISNVAAPNADTDAANKEYVDKAIQAVNQAAAGNAKIGYKANAEAAKQVAVGTGLTFKSGTGTVAPADLAPNTESTTKDTDGVTTKKGIAISTEENGIVNIGLDADTRKAIDNAAKLGNTATDGRDGKAGTGKDPKATDAVAGDKGLTGKDGLNGKDLTSKVNALRNGEAGTVVYTDDKGNRVVKANDGNYYKADDVKADGTVKTADENGGKAPEVVTAPQARLVNPDGSTTIAANTPGTKLSNIANGTIADKSKDAVNGGQLHTAKQELANALGGNAGVDANGALTQPTYSITKDDAAGGTDTVNNVGAAIDKLDTRINTVKGLTAQPLTFTGDDAQKVTRTLGTELTVKGAKNFTPSATTSTTDKGVNIRVEKDATAGANGLVVKLADTLTDMKGISGSGTDDLVIKNGTNTITVTPSKAAVKDDQGTVTTPADPGKVNFGDATVTVKDLEAPITYRANSVADTAAKSVSLKKGLDFVVGDGTTATATAAKAGLHIETGDNGKVIIGLSDDAKAKLDKVNDIATAVGANGVDGRDGKPGTGDNAGMGKDGLTAADGLNGKDLTSKVNALRNGEAGTVVYTDDKGNRVVKADDGKWYNAKAVDDKGKLKSADQLPTGVTATPVDAPQARLVNPTGTTTSGTTKLSNIAAGNIADGSTDAINGGQLFTKLAEKADKDLGNISSEGENKIKSLATGAVKVAAGKNTKVTADDSTPNTVTYVVDANDTIVTSTDAALTVTGGEVAGDNVRTYKLGLSQETKDTLSKVQNLANTVGTIGADGRDGKAGTGKDPKAADATAGDRGLTGKDGLNGKDLTTKVNALRNGEAGTVVYTNEAGDRVVKANDGKFYKADEVDDKGVAKPNASEVTKVEARVVNTDGTTTTATVFNNVASSIEKVKATDDKGAEIAKPTFLDRLKTAAATESSKLGVVNVKDLYDASKDIVDLGLDFYGNDEVEATGKVHRNLGTAVKIQGAGTFKRDKDATNNINVKRNAAQDGFTVELAENLTGMKEIAGDGKADLVIKNGDHTKITIKPGTAAEGNKPAVPGTVDFGGSKVTNIGTPEADTDVANKKYVDEAVGANANLRYAADTNEGAEAGKDYLALPIASKTLKIAGTKDQITTTAKDGTITIGLSETVTKQLANVANVGNTESDGRDGKSGVGQDGAAATGVAGAAGPTGKDGLNGKDVVSKVNALRNGEAGTVVYTDDKGNRLVKANDGNYYKATDVKEDGTVKTAAEAGTKDAPQAVTTPEARLVGPNGSTTGAPTKLSNIAVGNIAKGSTDAITGDQLHSTNERVGAVEEGLKGKADAAALDAKADKSKVEDLEKRMTKGRVFTADTKDGKDPLKAEVGLGDTLAIQGGATSGLTDNNIGVELKAAEMKDGKVVTPATMTVKLAKDLNMADGKSKYDRYLPEFEKDEKGLLKLQNGNPIPKKDKDGNVILQKDGNGKPIVNSSTVVDGNGTTYTINNLLGDGTVQVDNNNKPVAGVVTTTTAAGTRYEERLTTEDGHVIFKQDDTTKELKPILKTVSVVDSRGIRIGSNDKPVVSLTKDGLNNGGNTISNVAPGVYESDAATVGQLNAATNTVTAKVNEAGAHAAALAAMNPLSYDPLKKSQVMAGIGAYKGNKALALGVAHYANEDTMFNVGVSVGGGENMMNAGVTYRFGGEDSMIPERYKGGPISSVYILQDEVSALKAENAQVKADNEQVKADNARMKENYEKVMQDNEEMKAQIKMLMAHMGIK